MKELEYIYQNIIKFAFEVVETVQQGVELIEAFESLAKRQTII
jgi:dynein heavy chain